ncbi:Uncharacterised protein [Mycobacteroides abscessus subsp. abscessus]|nr:Uncharacterised protein [Mycobacteroides abscessus subsp. abscessus]
MVAISFPESRLIHSRKLDAAEPFGAFPEVKVRNDGAERISVFRGKSLAIMGVCQEARFLQEVCKRQVGRPSFLCMQNDK